MEYRILKEDELMHHGILGMSWGHRNGPPYPLDAGSHSAAEKRAGWRDSLVNARYRNKGGSYTKKGVEDYDKSKNKYKSSKEELQKKKSAYKRGEISKYDLDASKRNTREAKKKLKKDYKQLSFDKKADKGKDLYQRGKTITLNNQHLAWAQLGTWAVAGAAVYAANNGYKVADVLKYSALGAEAVTAAFAVKTAVDNDRIRAYYGHHR